MVVKDVIDIAHIRLKAISISRDSDVLIKIIGMGVSDLYNRFNLSVKTEVVPTVEEVHLYELKGKDVNLLLSVFDDDGRELRQTDILGSNRWQWKMVNYRSFLLNKPCNGCVDAVYKASPEEVSTVNDYIDLPDAMIQALLFYVAYMTNATLNTGASAIGRSRYSEAESNTAYQMYVNECNSLMMQGYLVDINSERISMALKGFV